jgi:hypothetical protein
MGGLRDNGRSGHMGELGLFWTSTPVLDDHAATRLIIATDPGVTAEQAAITVAASVRCIQG